MTENLKITGEWTEADNDYRREYATTSDPRILAVIERDSDTSSAIYGDVFAPAAWITYHGGWNWEHAGETFRQTSPDRDPLDAYVAALDHYGPTRDREELVKRYMRAFYGTTFREVQMDRSDTVVIFNTPAWREATGAESPDGGDILDGDVQTWRDVRDGDVYGVGYAVRPTHAIETDDIDLSDWDVEINCWGMIGEEYAKESAASFEYGAPDLPALLPLD